MDTHDTDRRGATRSARPKRIALSETEEGLAIIRSLAARRGVSVPDLLRILIREEASRAGLPVGSPETESGDERGAPIWERMAASMSSLPEEVLDALPEDLAEQHDHYLYGTPKR